MTARGAFSAFLAGLAGLLIVFGAACWSADHGVVSDNAFADKALDALHHDAVRRAVSQEIYAQVQPHVPAAAASPAQVRALVNRTVRGASFERVFREGALTTNRALFHNDGTDATLLVSLADVLRPTSPQLAQVVGDRDVAVLSLDAGSTLDRTSRTADAIRTLGLTLPFFAAAAFITALLVAPRRAHVLLAAGLGAAVAGGLLLAGLYVARAIARSQIEMAGVGDRLARDAASEMWSVYTADLRLIAIVSVVLGLLVAVGGGVLSRRRRTASAAPLSSSRAGGPPPARARGAAR